MPSRARWRAATRATVEATTRRMTMSRRNAVDVPSRSRVTRARVRPDDEEETRERSFVDARTRRARRGTTTTTTTNAKRFDF